MNNDLISRSELKKYFSDWHNWHTVSGYGKVVFLDKLLEKIDNAPTVEQFDDTELQRAIGYADGYSKGREERPQGEWIDYDNTFYKCPECGYLLEKCCPQCQNKVILPTGGAE